MLVVSDLEQPYIPIPYDLLVSLTESRSVIELFLKKLPVLFGSTQQTSSALGKALKFAEKMIVCFNRLGILNDRALLVAKLFVCNIPFQIKTMDL